MIQNSCRFLQIIVHQICCFFKAIKQRQLIIVNCLVKGCNNATRARVELNHAIRVVLKRRFLSSRPRSQLLDRNLTKYRYKASYEVLLEKQRDWSERGKTFSPISTFKIIISLNFGNTDNPKKFQKKRAKLDSITSSTFSAELLRVKGRVFSLQGSTTWVDVCLLLLVRARLSKKVYSGKTG